MRAAAEGRRDGRYGHTTVHGRGQDFEGEGARRESDGWQARSQALVDEKERLLANLEEGGHPVLDHMEQVVGKLREDFNGKVRELLEVQNQMMQQQIELRHRDERIKQLEGEVEARDNTIASLRDYVVDAGDFLARDKPFM